MERRHFLGTGLTAALALNSGIGSAANASECCAMMGGKCGMKIGLILYTVRDHLKTADEYEPTLAKVKEIGYDVVELAGGAEIETSKLAAILKKNELAAVAAHASWPTMYKDTQKEVDKYKELGCNHLVVSSMPGEFPRDANGYKDFAKAASEVGAKLLEAGMTLSYHNHSFEFEKYDGITGLETLRLYSIPKYFNFEIDTYWVQHGGGDAAEWIRKVGGRVPTVHLKDMVKFKDQQIFAEVGEGNMNWPAILEACLKWNVAYGLVEQDVCQRDSLESAAISCKNLKSWGFN